MSARKNDYNWRSYQQLELVPGIYLLGPDFDKHVREVVREELYHQRLEEVYDEAAPPKTPRQKPAPRDRYPNFEARLKEAIRQVLESTDAEGDWLPLTLKNIWPKMGCSRNCMIGYLREGWRGLTQPGETPKRTIMRLADEWFHELYVRSRQG